MQSIKMRSSWIRVGLKAMIGVLLKKREVCGQKKRCAGRMPWNHKGRGWNLHAKEHQRLQPTTRSQAAVRNSLPERLQRDRMALTVA